MCHMSIPTCSSPMVSYFIAAHVHVHIIHLMFLTVLFSYPAWTFTPLSLPVTSESIPHHTACTLHIMLCNCKCMLCCASMSVCCYLNHPCNACVDSTHVIFHPLSCANKRY